MAEQRPMKDGLSTAAVERICQALLASDATFPADTFRKDALNGLEDLELKERVGHLISVLHRHLPDSYPRAVDILLGCLPHWDYGDENDALSGFAAWPLIDYIGEHGLEHPELSLAALKQLTGLFSAEFAIRPFILKHCELTLSTLADWLDDKDPHVRRLVSEGTRPRLPWGMQLKPFIQNPTPILPLLEALKQDDSDYVRRSVANNLNDISKDHPQLLIDTAKRWQQDDHKHSRWIIKHAARTLVKAGHPQVFGLLGYSTDAKIRISGLHLDKTHISLGDSLQIKAQLISNDERPQKLVVDYAVHHQKADGSTTAKVFKLKNLTLAPGENLAIEKRHTIKAITTRRYYPGLHSVELLVNGRSYGKVDFLLSTDDGR